MDIKVKALLAVAPFCIAAAVGGTLAMPAYNDYQTKAQQVDEKKAEQEQLTAKLSGKDKLNREKQQIEKMLEGLRGSVPKDPELEILNMDLEKMCSESGVDLVAFKEPGREALRSAGLSEDSSSAASAAKTKVKAAAKNAAGAAGAQGAAASGSGQTAAEKAAARAAADPNAGLSSIIMQVKCIGDYNGMEELVKRLETYQRVVSITDLKAQVPKKESSNEKTKKVELPDDAPPGEADEQGDYRRMNISFLLTAYYLP